jgi:hypothetical protein
MNSLFNGLTKSVALTLLPLTLLFTSVSSAQSEEWVIRFSQPVQRALESLPDDIEISSLHEPYNIVVVKNADPQDPLWTRFLTQQASILRVEAGYRDYAGSPVYPTGDVILAPAKGMQMQCNSFLLENNLSVKSYLPALGWTIVTLPAGKSWAQFELEAISSGIFEHVMRDEIITAYHDDSNDPLYANCWHISQITDKDLDADEAWSLIPVGTGMRTVAVIDGHGFDTTHPDLAGQWADTFNAVDQTTNVMPTQTTEKHGTACAGIPGAAFNNSLGVPGLGGGFLNVQAIKIGYNISTSGSFSTSSTIQAAAINRTMTLASTVCISMSFGSSTYQTAFYNAITQARLQGRGGEGLVVLGSTGNNGLSTWTNYPASYEGVIAVGATTIGDFRSSFSNYGNGQELSAPGSGIPTTDVAGSNGYSTTDYTNFSGTSAACPVAASVAAMTIIANPQLSESEVRSILAQSCEKVGGYAYSADPSYPHSSWSNELGYGRVNMKNAVIAALQTSTSLADITLSAASVNNSAPTVGQTITISVNQQIAPATGNAVYPVVEYRWSVDQTWSSDDAIIGTDGSTLAAGTSSESETINYTVPAGTGVRYLLIRADTENAINESNESNNIAVLTLNVSPAPILPDITLNSFTANDLTPDVGQTITISCNQVITNGPSTAASATIQYRYSTDAVWTSDDVVIGTDISSLSASVPSESENITYTIPAGSGTRYVLVRVDVNNQVSEINENNNTYILTLNVNAPAATPDVSIVQITTASTSISELQSLNVLCQQSMTNAPALAVSVGFECRWSVDANWSADDAVVATGTSSLSSTNTSETESVTFNVPSGTGTRYLLFMADANNQITESNESNLFSIAFTVAAASSLPDIFIDAITISSSTVTAGQSVTINCDQNITLSNFNAVNVFMEYRWATSPSYSTSFPILGVDFSSLGAGDPDDPENLLFTVPEGTGQRFLLIVCDTGNNISEGNESNNVIAIPVNVVSNMTEDNHDDTALLPGYKEPESEENEIAVETGETAMVRNDLKIYPNPASDFIFIESADLVSKSELQIFDASGKLVRTQVVAGVTRHMIATADLPMGIYTLKLSTAHSIQTARMVISH